MSDALIEAMKAAGAKADDLWKVARTDIPPDQAVAELRRTYPTAFGPVFDARTASAADYAEAKKSMQEERRIADRNAYSRRELERLGIKLEDVR